jgi:ribose transport system permease protein
MSAQAQQLPAWLRDPLVIALAVILLLLAFGQAISPGFAGPRQVVGQLVIAALLGMVAAGQNLVILGGREGIDLSVGGMIGLGALIAGNLMQGQDSGILPAFAAVVAATFALGAVNGLGVTLLRIPPLVMTLGMAGVLQGLLVVLTRGQPSGNAAPGLVAFVTRPLVLGLPGILFVWLAVGAAMWLLLRRTAFGLRIFAIGTNEEAAALSGVAVARTRTLLFGLSGMFAGLAGFLVLGYTGNVFIGVGNQYVLPSIIAVVIGGTSLAGGSGGYWGTMAGAIVLVLLQSILTTLAIEPFGRQIIFGLALLGLMLFYGRQRRLRA